MDKSRFTHILHHFSESSAEDAMEILSLKDQYPYSQLLHTLSARVSKDHGYSHQQQQLQMAAVYAGDRNVLKQIMTRSFEDFVTPTAEEVSSVTEQRPIAPKAEPAVVNTSFDLAEEVIHDLERLNELKHNFEMLFVDVPETSIRTSTKTAPAVADRAPTNTATEEKPKESAKSKRARIIEMARSLNAESEGEKEVAPTTTHGKRKRENPVDTLIEEIESTKKEIEPGEKQKEQMEIIDQFIKIQPSITNQKDKLAQAPEGDLATIKNGEFGDNIVSETLVEILLKQGKKDKAIEVLKKLIWKFPQKKAYFAAQIEELKK